MLEETLATQNGLEFGHVRDRVFMVIDLEGEFITARTYPKMVLITPRIIGSVLSISAPGIEDFQIDIQKLHEMESRKIQTWFKDVLDVVDAGDNFAEWMSRCILGEKDGLRVVFYPSRDPKPKAVPRDRPFKAAGRVDQGAFADETSFMLLNQGSIDELNTSLQKPVTALRFRPNFLVKGPAAWEEDKWVWIKIGDETVLKNVQPCTRCLFTTIDPSTGEKASDHQPLKQLQKTRTFKASGPTPAFGIQLGVRQQGKVRIGDKVYVGC